MITIKSIADKFRALNTDKIIDESLAETKEAFIKANKKQLLEGKRSDGNDITPSYLDDPYFKTRESAQRYSDWKDRITPNPKRKSGTPNLFIKGPFHNSIDVSFNRDTISFDASFHAANAIEDKYTSKIFGLGGDIKKDYLNNDLSPVIQEKISTFVNLRFGS